MRTAAETVAAAGRVPVQATGRASGPSRDDVAAVLASPARVATWFQPIVDTESGRAAGWEALSRFTSPDGSPSPWGPADWFAAAKGSRLGAELEAVALRRALASVADLPPDTFLTMNVSPSAMTSEPVGRVLADHVDLSRVIIEITETDAVDDVRSVSSVCAGIRAAGGVVAVDDAGSGYAGLALIASLRPQLIKVDRELVSGCDSDPVRLSLMTALGVWAGGMDAWLLAEGVETAAEYAAVVDLGIPLVQGWFTGRPGPEPVGPTDEVLADLRHQRSRVMLREAVASVMVRWPVVPRDSRAQPGPCVLTDGGRPVALVDEGDDLRAVSLRVRPSEHVQEALRRAMGRQRAARFDPLVVTDGQGSVVGVVRVEALVARLLEDDAV